MPARNAFFKKPFVQTCCVVFSFLALGFLIYSNNLNVSFMLDDVSVIVRNPVLKYHQGVAEIFRYDPSRFITHLSFAIQARGNTLNPFSFHLVNLALHILCSILVYFLSKKTLALAKARGFEGDKNIFPVSFFCGLIFLSHPMQTESVTYIAQRSTLLAALCLFSSIILYLKIKENFSRRLYFLNAGILILGTMTKPIFIVTPLIILLYEKCFFGLSMKNLRKQFSLRQTIQYLPYGVVLTVIPMFLLLFSLSYLSQPLNISNLVLATQTTSEISRGEYALTQLKVLVHYLRLLAWPAEHNVDYDMALSHNLFEPKTFFSFVVLLGLMGFSFFLRKRKPLLTFGVVWFFVVLIPDSSIFPLSDIIFEHRLYLAVFGFSLVMCLALFSIVQNAKRAIFFLLMLVLCFALLTYGRNAQWGNEEYFWKDVIAKSPAKARPHNQLGLFYEKKEWPSLADGEYQKAIALDEKYIEPYHNLAKSYLRQKRYADALALYQKAMEFYPQDFDLHRGLGKAYAHAGEYESAMAQYQQALTIKPENDGIFLEMGNLYAKAKNIPEARAAFQRALQSNRYNTGAYYGLAQLNFEEGNDAQALKELETAVSIHPRYADAYNLMGVVCDAAGDFIRAESYFKKAVELEPDLLNAYLNLVNFYRKSGRVDEAEKFLSLALGIEKRRKK